MFLTPVIALSFFACFTQLPRDDEAMPGCFEEQRNLLRIVATCLPTPVLVGCCFEVKKIKLQVRAEILELLTRTILLLETAFFYYVFWW